MYCFYLATAILQFLFVYILQVLRKMTHISNNLTFLKISRDLEHRFLRGKQADFNVYDTSNNYLPSSICHHNQAINRQRKNPY